MNEAAMNEARRRPTPPAPAELAVIALVALATYAHLFGIRTLDPGNVAWMLHGDPAQHYLGWQFFRHEAWAWPPGRIAGFGLPDGTSIVFSDTIPLLALALKPFSALLPDEFQYFGPWMLLCFVLNGYFGLRLLTRISSDRLLRVLGALLFIFSPPLFMRAYGHEALMAHWLLLASMDTYLGGWRFGRWSLWLLLAALIHPYLLLMTLGLFAAAAYKAAGMENSLHRRVLLAQCVLAGLLLVGVMWACGYFTSKGNLSGGGYGFFSMNLLALIEPVFIGPEFGSSPFLASHATATAGQYEGYLYLGAGGLFLAVVALALRLQGPPQPGLAPQGLPPRAQLAPLCLVAFAFWLLALSNSVTFAGHHLFTVPLPDVVLKALSVFRASGRFGWPAFYLITFAIIALILPRLSRPAAFAILAAGLLLQIADHTHKYREFRHAIRERGKWSTPLQDPRWHDFAAAAQQLVLIPPHPVMETIYLPFAHLAAAHRLATNAAHTARADADRRGSHGAQSAAELAGGHHDPRVLYVMVQPEAVERLPRALQTRLVTLDGYRVLPPVAP